MSCSNESKTNNESHDNIVCYHSPKSDQLFTIKPENRVLPPVSFITPEAYFKQLLPFKSDLRIIPPVSFVSPNSFLNQMVSSKSDTKDIPSLSLILSCPQPDQLLSIKSDSYLLLRLQQIYYNLPGAVI